MKKQAQRQNSVELTKQVWSRESRPHKVTSSKGCRISRPLKVPFWYFSISD